MTYKLIILLSCIAFLISCKSTHIQKTQDNNTPNNKIYTVGDNIDVSQNYQSKIIFNGTNNKVIIEYFNSFFNSKNSRDVIIIEGNGNTIRIRHDGIIDNSVNSCDTLIIQGNDSYIELLQKYILDNSKESKEKKTIEINKDFRIIENEKSALISDSSEIENKITNKWMPIKEVYLFYLNDAINGNPVAAFYLGEFYQLGLGTKLNIKNAEYFYLIAAKKGHIKAQAMLGYLYENDFDKIGFDKEKAISWYKLAAQNGDDFAIERLKQINE